MEYVVDSFDAHLNDCALQGNRWAAFDASPLVLILHLPGDETVFGHGVNLGHDVPLQHQPRNLFIEFGNSLEVYSTRVPLVRRFDAQQ
jgi:hypothetical protein